MHSTILILILFTLLHSATARPDGAGSCAAGISAIETNSPENRHIQYAGFPGSTEIREGDSGSLFDGATTVTLNGETLVADASTIVAAGIDLVWEVTAVQVAFKGILVRVEKESDDFTNVGRGELKNNDLCDMLPGVIGVTHDSNDPKTLSSGTINFSSGGVATLDITVVYDNVDRSLYAFSTFQLEIEEELVPTIPVSVPTTTPIAVPSPIVIVPVPTTTPSGTQNPTSSPFGTQSPTFEFPTPEFPTLFPTFIDAPVETVEPTFEKVQMKGMMKGGMDSGVMKGGMGMDNKGTIKGGMGMGGTKGEKEPKVKAGKVMGGKKGDDDDEYTDDDE